MTEVLECENTEVTDNTGFWDEWTRRRQVRRALLRQQLLETGGLPARLRVRLLYKLLLDQNTTGQVDPEQFKQKVFPDLIAAAVGVLPMADLVKGLSHLLIDPKDGMPSMDASEGLGLNWGEDPYLSDRERFAVMTSSNMLTYKARKQKLLQPQIDSNRDQGIDAVVAYVLKAQQQLRAEERGSLLPLSADRPILTDYLIEGVLADRQPCVIGGPHKSGKTQLAVELAVALASGRPFLGTYRVPRSLRVVAFSGESGQATLSGYLTRSGPAPGLRLYDRLPTMPFLADLLTAEPAEVVILDPLYLLLQGDQASNLFVMGQQLATLTALCLAVGATPVLVHHSVEGVRPGAFPGLDDLSFAGIKQYARQWMLVNRRLAYTPGPDRLWVMFGGSAGHSSLVGVNHTSDPWTWGVLDRDDAKAEDAKHKEERKQSGQLKRTAGQAEARLAKVLEALRGAGGPLKATKLKTVTGLNGTNLKAVLDGLLTQDLIRQLPDNSFELIPAA